MAAGLSLLWFQLQLATDITRLMNTSVDPCVNFYDFACGNYKNRVTLPEDKSSMQRFTETDDQIKKELRALFEAQDNDDDPKSTQFAKRFYRSCTNVTKLEELGLNPLKDFLEKYGGWPVVKGDAWKESDYDWIKMSARIQTTLGEDDILSFTPGPDFKNSSKKTLFIDQASLGLGRREFYLEESNKKILDAYYEFMVATAVQLGASAALAKKELQEVLNFEVDLAKITVREEDRRDNNAVYRPMSIKDLKAKYPKMNFDLWFKTVAAANWHFLDSDIINLSGAPYLEKLPEVLSKYSPRVFANFQVWSITMGLVSSLAPSLRENYRKYKQVLSGTSKFKPRWEECVGATTDFLSREVGAIYVKKYFSEKNKIELDKMVVDIREAMKSTIDNIDWMDSKTKSNAQKKLSAVIQSIAFPSPDIYNETWVMKNHLTAEISDSTYLANKISLDEAVTRVRIREFRDPVNRTEWEGQIAIVNAFYSPEKNRMTFPAGILRYSWYHPYAPDYYNFGHIGSVMGHELTHGFDDQGRQFDENGNFELWWTNETLGRFTEGAQCFIQQYSNVTDPITKQTLNGENTQGENIADNGGVKLAFKAFQNKRKNSADERNKILPHLSNYTAEQLYFLSYAQAWCTLIRPEALKVQIVEDYHSPGIYRVNVPLKNNEQFAAAYKCPSGSPMNPIKKCAIW